MKKLSLPLILITLLSCTKIVYVQEAEVVKIDTLKDGRVKDIKLKKIGSKTALKSAIGKRYFVISKN